MNELSADCQAVLFKLAHYKNVLLGGPPATGKTRLMAEVAQAFMSGPAFLRTAGAVPYLDPFRMPPVVPPPAATLLSSILPAAARSQRKVFSCPFHQGLQTRDFLTGLVPDVTRAGAFKVVTGALHQANEFAKQPDSASLLLLDELNRGPAAKIFGPAIAALEADKRLNEDGSEHARTAYFQVMDPASGDLKPYALSPHVYIVAAYNRVDVSVDPLDTAFLRRWTPHAVTPCPETLSKGLGVSPFKGAAAWPASPDHPQDVACVLQLAWRGINERIEQVLGADFVLGHGVLMDVDLSGLDAALQSSSIALNRVLQHVFELFSEEPRQLAYVLRAGAGAAPYVLEDRFNDGMTVLRVKGPLSSTPANCWSLLRHLARMPG